MLSLRPRDEHSPGAVILLVVAVLLIFGPHACEREASGAIPPLLSDSLIEVGCDEDDDDAVDESRSLPDDPCPVDDRAPNLVLPEIEIVAHVAGDDALLLVFEGGRLRGLRLYLDFKKSTSSCRARPVFLCA